MTARADRDLPLAPLPCCLRDGTAICEGRSASGPDALRELCRAMLAAGFAPQMGLIVREYESGPVVRVVKSIAAEAESQA